MIKCDNWDDYIKDAIAKTIEFHRQDRINYLEELQLPPDQVNLYIAQNRKKWAHERQNEQDRLKIKIRDKTPNYSISYSIHGWKAGIEP